MLKNESCIITMQTLKNVDLAITSPPYDNMRMYGGKSQFDFKAIANGLYKVLIDGGVLVWIVADQTKKGSESGSSLEQALYFKSIGFNLFDTMIYAKEPRGAVGNNRGYWGTFEYMFILSKGKPKTINLIHDRVNKESRDGDNGTRRLMDGSLKKVKRGGYGKFGRRTNIWTYLTGKGLSTKDDIAFKHPAIFPEALAKDHILSWSNPGDLIYDPMMGSGTVGKMAISLNRKFVGSEINKEYFNIAKKRIYGKKTKSR